MGSEITSEDVRNAGHIFFLGIGGIGMSALARYFKKEGKHVSGYDLTETRLTKKLVDEGMEIHYQDKVKYIPVNIDLVIYTPAIPQENNHFQWFVQNRYEMYKRSEILGWISRQKKCIAIAGTHGKTTTASMVTHILKSWNLDPLSFVGGIMKNYHSNFLYGTGDWVIVEADEYDRSFLYLQPDVALITAIDPDHLDIYKSYPALVRGYREFTGNINDNGHLWLSPEAEDVMGPEWKKELSDRGVQIFIYGSETGELKVVGKETTGSAIVYTVIDQNEKKVRLTNAMPGEHNLKNAIGAMGIASSLGIDATFSAGVLADFKGIERRFEKVYEDTKIVIINDYAHHPAEIESVIQAAKELYGDKKLTVVFQPHLYSRTRDFFRDFAAAFRGVDTLILTEIYPAREKPIQGISSQLIFDLAEVEHKKIVEKENLQYVLSRESTEILMILGAGDVDEEIDRLIKKLSNA